MYKKIHNNYINKILTKNCALNQFYETQKSLIKDESKMAKLQGVPKKMPFIQFLSIGPWEGCI